MSTSDKNNNAMRYAGLASQMMVMLGVGFWAGFEIDKRLAWKIPVFLILIPLIALIISLWQLINELNKPKK